MFACSTLVVEGNGILGGVRLVGDDEADASGWRRPRQRPNLAPVRNRLCRVEAMLEGVFITVRRARRLPAVYLAAAVLWLVSPPCRYRGLFPPLGAQEAGPAPPSCTHLNLAARALGGAGTGNFK